MKCHTRLSCLGIEMFLLNTSTYNVNVSVIVKRQWPEGAFPQLAAHLSKPSALEPCQLGGRRELVLLALTLL